jgi:DNA-binding transcriptional LysR family regulator
MASGTADLSDQLQALRLFVQIACTGSISKGAREMKLSQPIASRVIALLEEQLGVTLFSRSTRALTLTDSGASYLGRAKPILESLQEADDAIRGSDNFQGTLRIAAPSIFASRVIVPRLGSFATKHPNLLADLTIDDRRQDLIQEGIHVAIRFGKLPDSTAVARLIGRRPLIVTAAPAYLEIHGTPDSPAALGQHTFVVAGPVAGKELIFRRGEKQAAVLPRGTVSIDGAEVAVSAVRAGIGIGVASLPSFSQDLDTGDLVQLLPDWRLNDIEAHALYASGQNSKPAARAFVDHLLEELRTTQI